MATNVLGYNVLLKWDSKLFKGVTQDDLSITATTKESVTKEDAGNKTSTVTGHQVKFTVTGNMVLDDTSTASDAKYRNDIMAQALKTGSAAEITVVYSCASGASYTGTAVMDSYAESTNSEDVGTYTINLTISGAFTPVE